MRIKTVFAFVLSFFLTACSEVIFQMADGDKQPLSKYNGQWLLINYWAEWCRPCLDEIPELNKLNKASEIQVIGFDYDKESGAALSEKIKRIGIKFPVVIEDPSDIFSQQEPSGLPATMLINQHGKFVRWLMGPQTVDSIKAEIEK